MAGITLRTARQVVPMIYAYTTPEIARHNGWTKIGYTEQSVDKRLKQQTHTADVLYHEEWRGNAVYDDGSGEVFTDHDFHAYLRKLNVENDRKNEWFHLDGQQSRRYFQDFRMNRGRVQLDAAIAYTLREEQARAVRDTKIYYQSHPGGEYLWNAKPRFGKTLPSTISASRSMHRRCLLSPIALPSPIAGTATMCAFWAGSPAICSSAMWMPLPGSPMCWTSKAIWMPPHRARNCISALSSSACRT